MKYKILDIQVLVQSPHNTLHCAVIWTNMAFIGTSWTNGNVKFEMLKNKLPHPTQLNYELGKPYFPKKPQPRHTKPQPSVTFSQLLQNQTRPYSACRLISTQLDNSCKKIGRDPPPLKNTKISTILFEPKQTKDYFPPSTPRPHYYF